MKTQESLEDNLLYPIKGDNLSSIQIAGNEAFFFDNYGNLVIVYISFGDPEMLGTGVLGFYAFTQNKIMLLYDAPVSKVLNHELNHKFNQNNLETEIRRKDAYGSINLMNRRALSDFVYRSYQSN